MFKARGESRPFRYSGIIGNDDPWHVVLAVEESSGRSQDGVLDLPRSLEEAGKPTVLVPPRYVHIGEKRIPQWAPTVVSHVRGYKPAEDCDGDFMPYKFQPNNNCYNYACNIATNSFAQPGRLHGISIMDGNKLDTSKVRPAAEKDGLIPLADSSLPVEQVGKRVNNVSGHIVALLLSEPDEPSGWRGDYHWVRCDTRECNTWSQKSGYDQVTNLDFTGRPIVDPANSKWQVNQGPDNPGSATALLVEYSLEYWMFVPYGKVNII